MKKIFILLGLAASPLIMKAQQFLVEHDTAYLYTTGDDDAFVTVYNKMENLSSDAYNYSWRFLNTGDLPAGWVFNGFCDKVACRIPGFPVNWQTGEQVTGVPFPGRSESDLKLQLDIPASGPDATVIFKLEISSPEQTDTIYYFVSKSTSSVHSIPVNDLRFQIFPNPTNVNYINIQSSLDLNIQEVRVHNLLGQNVLNLSVANKENAVLDLSGLQSGVYMISGYDKNNHNIVNRKFTKN